MPDILTAALLAIPIVASAAHLLRKCPRQTVILASETARHLAPVSAYLVLTVGPGASERAGLAASPSPVISYTALAVRLTPTTVRRIVTRLNAANDEERDQQKGQRE